MFRHLLFGGIERYEKNDVNFCMQLVTFTVHLVKVITKIKGGISKQHHRRIKFDSFPFTSERVPSTLVPHDLKCCSDSDCIQILGV